MDSSVILVLVVLCVCIVSSSISGSLFWFRCDLGLTDCPSPEPSGETDDTANGTSSGGTGTGGTGTGGTGTGGTGTGGTGTGGTGTGGTGTGGTEGSNPIFGCTIPIASNYENVDGMTHDPDLCEFDTTGNKKLITVNGSFCLNNQDIKFPKIKFMADVYRADTEPQVGRGGWVVMQSQVPPPAGGLYARYFTNKTMGSEITIDEFLSYNGTIDFEYTHPIFYNCDEIYEKLISRRLVFYVDNYGTIYMVILPQPPDGVPTPGNNGVPPEVPSGKDMLIIPTYVFLNT